MWIHRHTVYALMSIVALCLISCDDEPSATDDLPQYVAFFDVSPINVDAVDHWAPMGQLNVHPKGHGGLILKSPFQLPAQTPVIAVNDGVIIEVGKGLREIPDFAEPEQNRGKQYEDHFLKLQTSKSTIVNYGHVTTINDVLLPQVSSIPADERGYDFQIKVKAGDTLGWVGPHPSLDFSVTDLTLELSILNSQFYNDNQYKFSADIYSYFREPTLGKMFSIANRDAPPWGGKIDYDVEGRIVGNWFEVSINEYTQWSKHLCIAYDHNISSRIMVSDGSPMRDVAGYLGPGSPDLYWVRHNSPLPEDIGVQSGKTIFELIPPYFNGPDEQAPLLGYMMVEMPKDGELLFEIFPGSQPPTDFTTRMRSYKR